MNVNKFDGRVKKWTLDSQYNLNSERINIYNLTKNNLENLCEINIDQRIGMESTMAEVFKVSLSKDINIYSAGKILPITNDNSYINNEKEIRFAIEASELVINNESLYFPLVYDFILCNETYFYDNNKKLKPFSLKFYEKSLRYQRFKFLKEYKYFSNLEINNEIVDKILKYKRNLVEPDIIVNKINEYYSLNVILPDKIQSHILFSELACFDLDYYISFLSQTNNLNLKNLNELLKHIFLAIRDMTLKLDLLHQDLHLGNILLINDKNSKNGYIPLIHDFGKSRKLKYKKSGELEHFDKEHDLFYFLSKFEEKINDLEDTIEEKDFKLIKNCLSEIIDIFYDSKEIFPIVDIIKYWENLNF